MQPPITREAAGEYLKTEIPPEAWQEICRAFAMYGDVLDALDASRASKSKDPAKASWHERQKSTVKALEAALDRLQATRKHGAFLHEASENYSLANLGQSAGTELNADRMLRDAYRKILDALVIIERAEPMAVDVPTEATVRAVLVRDIRDALVPHGIEVRASTGFALDEIPDRAPRLLDLTPFEQFVDVLGIGDEMTVASFSSFVRSTLAGEKRG